jgi:hypothetical protein
MKRGSPIRAQLAVLALCAFLLSLVLGDRLSENEFRGSDLQKVVSGDFSSDAWVGTQASVTVPGFLGGVNRLNLHFGVDRPGASEPARVAVSSCGSTEREVTLDGAGIVRLTTSLGCAPLQAQVRALNFFSPPGERSGRELGVQLKGVAVESPLKLTIAAPGMVCAILMILLGLVFLTWFVSQQAGVPGIPASWAVLASVVALVFLVEDSPEKLEPVAMVLLGALTGMSLYSWQRGRSLDLPRTSAGWLVWVALSIGAALRFYGISFGLPANFHPDEVPKVNAIMRMVDGKALDPQYFLHPSLLLYLTYGMNHLLHLIGIEGSFRETAFLAGRLVSALAGLGSIVLTYQIGKRLFSKETGGMAAVLLAVFPLHVTCSRYLKEDSLLTFVVLASVLVTIVAVQTQRRALLLVAGFLAGCTAGAKYSGILMAVVPASAPWIASRSIKPDMRWIPWAAAAVLIAPLGFLYTTPYAVLNSAKFIKDFSAESRHMQTGHTVTITAWSQLWMYHFWRSITPGVSLLVAVVACVAFGFLLRRGRLEDLIVLGVALLFYLPAEYVKAKPAPQPERYILPCLPFLALGVAELVRSVSGYKQRALKALVPVCVVALVALPALRSFTLAREITNDTRDQLASWMKANLPQGSKVLMDWKPYCPNFHGEFFEVEHIPRARIIQELDVSALRSSGAQYLVVSSLFYNRYFTQPESEPVLRQRFREVFQRVPVITQYAAPSGPYGFHNPTLTLFSLDQKDFELLEAERSRKSRGEIAFTSNEVRARAKW